MKTDQTTPRARTRPAAYEKHGDVQALLTGIARAVTAGDGEAVADLWDVPAFVIGADMARAVASRHELVEFFGGARQAYNDRGIVDTRADIVDEEWVGDRLVVVKVRWPYLDAAGNEIGAEASDYTLCRDSEDQLKVRVVLMRGVEQGRH